MRVFKPYLKAGAGTNPLVEYVIDDGQLTIKRKFGASASIDLPPDSHQTVQNAAQSMMDIGDVIVRKHGNELKCEKVSGVKAFVAALYQKSQSAVDEAPKAPVSQGYRSGQTVVVVTGLPESFCTLIWNINGRKPVDSSWGVVGKWAAPGDVMYGNGYDLIKAPNTGQFLGSPNAYYPEIHTLLERHGLQLSTEGSDAACFFLPAQGQECNLPASAFHGASDIIEAAQHAVTTGKLPRSLRNSDGFIEQLREDWKSFRSKPLLKVSINDMPHLDSDYSIRSEPDISVPPQITNG